MVRSILWLLTIAVMMYGCKEAQPAGPGAGDVVIYEVKTDVNPDRVFLVRGTNLYVLSDVGSVVCYEQGHGDIRIPMKIVFGETSFSCILPDSVRSGRIKVVDGSGKALMDTVLRIYGDYSSELAWLPSDLVWNQSIQVRGSMMPVLVDQDMHHHTLIAHPSRPGTWLIPHRTGSFRWVGYDTTTRLYHAARTLVKIPRPGIGMVSIDNNDVMAIKDYVSLEGERIKLISASHTYEREMHQYAGNVIVSMIGMDVGRYHAEVGGGGEYQKLDGEVSIDKLPGEDHELSSTRIEISGRHMVGLRTITVTMVDNEPQIDTSSGSQILSFLYRIEQCTLERMSHNVFQIRGQTQADSSVSLYGTIVKEDNSLITDLTFTEEGPGQAYTKQHRVKLRRRPYTIDPNGLVEIVIGDEDFVRTGEYYYSGRETTSTPTLRQEKTENVTEGGRFLNSLTMRVRL